MKQKKKCHNCENGSVPTQKRVREVGRDINWHGKCFYCKGAGTR